MPGETDLHKTLKKEACRWLYRMGYRCIAAEVRLSPLGIVDAVGTGIFRPYYNYLGTPSATEQVCFVECKASRADYLHDMEDDGQMLLQLANRRDRIRTKMRRRRPRNVNLSKLGKFRSCLVCPMANLHYVLAPAGLIRKSDLPPRWGLLALSEAGVNVIVRADWQEMAQCQFVESAIARTLTGDIYRADMRAMDSVNREIFAQQQNLADRIRGMKPQIVLAPTPQVKVPATPPRGVPPRIGWPVGR